MDAWIAAFWFFLPAGIANLTPVFASRLPLLRQWNSPLDNGRTFRGKRLLGKNKTVRGLVCGTIVAGIVSWVLFVTGQSPANDQTVALLFGLLLGFGALSGDTVESFFKRQNNVPSGKSWFPFDQVDYIAGGLLLSLPFGVLSADLAARVFVLYFALHVVTSAVAYFIGLKETII